MALGQVRGGVPAGLCLRRRGARLARPLPRLLQWPTAALEPGRANPGPGLLRRSAAAGGGMKTTAVCGPRSGWATPSLREARKRQRTTETAGDPLIRRRTLSERSRPQLSNTLTVNYQKTVPDVLQAPARKRTRMKPS